MKNKLFIACLAALLLVPFAEAKIVFSGGKIPEEAKNLDIFVMDDDGSNLKKITHTPEHEGRPYWSPDGKRIAFSRSFPRIERRQVSNIFIIDADGSNEQRLTQHPDIEFYPVFLPDGRHLSFSRTQNGTGSVYTIDLETLDIERFIDIDINEPDWSPDTRTIACEIGGKIYTMTADGKNQKRPLPPPKDAQAPVIYRFNPKWSPDGRSLLYIETRYTAQLLPLSNTIYIYNFNLRTQAPLPISKDWRFQSAVWIDDGKTLILAADEVGIKNQKHGNINIYRYNIPSNTMTQLTHLPGMNYSVHWVQGALDVLPKEKKTTLWGKIKNNP